MKEFYNKRYFKLSKKFQMRKSRIEELSSIIMTYHPKRVLDVGCGLSMVVHELRKSGIDAWGIDWAETLKKDFGLKDDFIIIGEAKQLPFADKEFDIVFSSDFFEHIPEDEIEQIREEMVRVGKKVLARIAYGVELHNNQSKAHCTNQPKDFWVRKLPGIILI